MKSSRAPNAIETIGSAGPEEREPWRAIRHREERHEEHHAHERSVHHALHHDGRERRRERKRGLSAMR
jgi:hypothetical protein